MADVSIATAPPGFVIAAPQSGSGKTLVTLGLLAAMRARGVTVQSYKIGPDYIDPAFHAAASGRPCLTLDLWAMRDATLHGLMRHAAGAAELTIVEGVMGLFDGPETGEGSTADVAARLGLPVVLVVDSARQSRSVAALVQGFARFDHRITVAGAILTRVASERHERLLRDALASAGIACFGALRTDAQLTLPSRHLGLVQASEHADLTRFLAVASEAVTRQIDITALRTIAAPPTLPTDQDARVLVPLGQRIAMARDEAFAFAYAHLLRGWQAQGAEIMSFSPLADEGPDDTADAVFLPGGYPELHAGRLAANDRFRAGMLVAYQREALIYGECGGYMVLGEALTDAESVTHPMLGLLPIATSFADRKRHLGYREIELPGQTPLPWPHRLAGHEFHYATETVSASDTAFSARDSAGSDLGSVGAVSGRVVGSFLHVIDARDPV
ncbi:MAG: cobyrinate a,c-diamide synthase [Pseudomonadota bacterium]